MKKFLAIAVIAASIVACNNKSDKPAEVKDTTTVAPTPVDTNKMAPVDTNKMATVDTSKKSM